MVAAGCEKKLHGHARGGHRPDEDEQRIAPCAAQHDEADWRIGTRDEKVNAGVIERLHAGFPAQAGEKMIERRGAVEHHQRDAKDGGGDEFVRIASGENEHHAERDECEDDADAVRPQAGDFLAVRVAKVGTFAGGLNR